MTPEAYHAALARLGLTPASKETAKRLGISVRHSQRLASGERNVTPTIEALLRALSYGEPHK